jgi:molecular chaperone DnaJ
MTAAALGTELTLETFDGEQTVTLRPGTQSGDVITLAQLGVARLRGSGRGDLLVHVNVEVPTKLDAEQEELLRQFAKLRGEHVGEGKLVGTGGGMFAKLRDKFGNL